jgi:hypothetical protein
MALEVDGKSVLPQNLWVTRALEAGKWPLRGSLLVEFFKARGNLSTRLPNVG